MDDAALKRRPRGEVRHAALIAILFRWLQVGDGDGLQRPVDRYVVHHDGLRADGGARVGGAGRVFVDITYVVSLGKNSEI